MEKGPLSHYYACGHVAYAVYENVLLTTQWRLKQMGYRVRLHAKLSQMSVDTSTLPCATCQLNHERALKNRVVAK